MTLGRALPTPGLVPHPEQEVSPGPCRLSWELTGVTSAVFPGDPGTWGALT